MQAMLLRLEHSRRSVAKGDGAIEEKEASFEFGEKVGPGMPVLMGLCPVPKASAVLVEEFTAF